MDKDLQSIADARDCARRSRKAFEAFRRFEQDAVDHITAAVVEAGFAQAGRLGRLAVEESGIGSVPGKTAKNRFATRGLWQGIRELKTCGIVGEDPDRGVWEVADPFGVVAAVIPTTNPTSTALFKAIICLKSRNAMVASPHPRSAGCIRETIRVCQEAALAAGAPADLLTCMQHVSLEGTRELMHLRDVDLILATGGSGLVRAAYSSGKPAFGVGPGNVPVYVDASADLELAARCLVESQTFDNGTICSSEQAIACDRPVVGRLRRALEERGALFCDEEQTRALERIALRDGVTNPDIVGLSAARVAELAGFPVPAGTTVLIAPQARDAVGHGHPLSYEKLCPLLAFYEVDGWEDGCHLCLEVLELGGRGHTLGLFCERDEIIRAFAIEKPVNRLLVNSPTSQGAVGLSTALFPSMTLGCGSFGGNITSDNIGPQHLVNIKRVAWVRPEWRAGTLDPGFDQPATRSDEVASAAARGWEPHRGDRDPVPDGTAASPASARTGLMGWPAGPRPGEHFSDDDLERIVHDALARRGRANRQDAGENSGA